MRGSIWKALTSCRLLVSRALQRQTRGGGCSFPPCRKRTNCFSVPFTPYPLILRGQLCPWSSCTISEPGRHERPDSLDLSRDRAPKLSRVPGFSSLRSHDSSVCLDVHLSSHAVLAWLSTAHPELPSAWTLAPRDQETPSS